MEKDIDLELYNKYLEGDKKAFETLYNKYKGKIEYFIYNIIKDFQKAEDLTQETFISLIQSNIDAAKTIKYHLYLIAKSKALNYLSVEKRRNEITDTYINKNSTDSFEKDVLEIIANEETKREVLSAIEKLEDNYRSAVYLTSIEGLSYEEVASILGQPLSNIKNLVHRGKRKLRKIIKEEKLTELDRIRKMLLIFFTFTILIAGTTIAVVTLYNNYFEYRNMKIEDFERENGFLYKKLYTYEEYLKYEEQVSNAIDVKENDFNDNFMIIVVSERTKLNGLEFKQYKTENNKLILELISISKDKNIMSSGVAVMIPKTFDSYEIGIEKVSNDSSVEKYTDLKELPNDYSKDNAIQDNCLVIDQNEKKTYNQSILQDFMSNVENKIDSEIRIYLIENKKIFIQAVKYVANEKFIVTYDYTRYRNDELSYETDEIYTDKINKKVVTSFNENIEIYTIEDNNNSFTFAIYQ